MNREEVELAAKLNRMTPKELARYLTSIIGQQTDRIEALTAREAALVAQVEALTAHSETMHGQLQRMVDRWEALTADNERLRGALRYMVDTSLIDDDYRDIARAALEAKP